MIVAIMSDSHDNIWNLRKAVEIIKNSQAGLLIHCGDFIAPFMLKENVTLLNPGEIMGKEGSPGFCFVDTKSVKIERVEL